MSLSPDKIQARYVVKLESARDYWRLESCPDLDCFEIREEQASFVFRQRPSRLFPAQKMPPKARGRRRNEAAPRQAPSGGEVEPRRARVLVLLLDCPA